MLEAAQLFYTCFSAEQAAAVAMGKLAIISGQHDYQPKDPPVVVQRLCFSYHT